MGVGVRVVTVISCVKARDAAKLPTVERTAPTTKNYLIPNVNGSKIDELWATEEQKLLQRKCKEDDKKKLEGATG